MRFVLVICFLCWILEVTSSSLFRTHFIYSQKSDPDLAGSKLITRGGMTCYWTHCQKYKVKSFKCTSGYTEFRRNYRVCKNGETKVECCV